MSASIFTHLDDNHPGPWNPHPAFTGVSLKATLCGADTNNAFSAHLVRIDPGCVIGMHTHETQCELHEVAEGSGQCVLAGEVLDYAPGVSAVMPVGAAHEVRAGKNGLKILAKFVPPLV
ncbi:cupin domain-containing protein [Pseudodesulfovibrio senegalensis]|jgi:quercetin dioxygenase-like cupin family protein|uniref:Cupin domain-containing protein n=1 Tax=Pseudodesulfovibrio senegalensis TaxID=1721087 RepID=A0A6N6MZI6_9BACT|nr:cupin domain-containing protein [Pseudodesulfovibrio senegalensis]KAB1439135.1 cupin domain-containing protein [Pseudodesulfovibrio senegalensis]